MKIYERIRTGLNDVLTFCAIWIGAFITAVILIDKETSWWAKLIISIMLLLSFLNGYFNEKKEQDNESKK